MFESEYYTTWEKYQEEHLNASDNACKTEKIQNYEEEMFKFIMMLFL